MGLPPTREGGGGGGEMGQVHSDSGSVKQVVKCESGRVHVVKVRGGQYNYEYQLHVCSVSTQRIQVHITHLIIVVRKSDGLANDGI